MIDISEKNHFIKKHKHSRNDIFFWLNKKENKKVKKIIDKCNFDFDLELNDTTNLQNKLINEFLSLTKLENKSLSIKLQLF